MNADGGRRAESDASLADDTVIKETRVLLHDDVFRRAKTGALSALNTPALVDFERERAFHHSPWRFLSRHPVEKRRKRSPAAPCGAIFEKRERKFASLRLAFLDFFPVRFL